MPLLHIILLALIQGITEFLPISSSGHLVLFHALTENNVATRWGENLTLDVAVHVGTLGAVLVYFRHDVCAMLCGARDVLTGNVKTQNARLGLYVMLGSLPVILAGLALYMAAPAWMRSLEVMAWCTIIFGVLLWWVDVNRPHERKLETLTFRDALYVGLAQVLALVPGTSRSGITMTAARWLGFTRTEAARFSLLLSIVAIAGAGTLSTFHLIKSGNMSLGLDAALAAFLAFLSALGVIALMMRWLEKSSFTVFAAYRVLLGIVLLGLLYSGFIPQR